MGKRSTGEGSIVQRTDGRWQASLQVDGRRRTVYGRTRAEAAGKLADLRQQALRAGTMPDPGRRTVDDLLTAWLEAVTPSLKPRTISDYAYTCRRYIRPAIGSVLLARLGPEHVQRLLSQLQSEGHQRTAQLVYALLHRACHLAVMWRWLSDNPCRRVIRPTHRADRKVLWSPEQMRTFINGAEGHWLWPLWVVTICLGARLSELVGLRWIDVDLAGRIVVVRQQLQRVGGKWITSTPKTAAGSRQIGMPLVAVAALRAQEAQQLVWQEGAGNRWHDTDLVFTTELGRPLHRAVVARAMRKECARLNLPPMTMHGLRHLHASLLLTQGLPVPEVSRRLGHANPGITMSVYAHAIRMDDGGATGAIEQALRDDAG